MKNLLTIIIFAASFSMVGCYTTGQVPEGNNYSYPNDYSNRDVSYQTFYNQLQPYGNWINYPQYGYVWQPYEVQGFRPYESGGHWVSTVDGWAWASDYNWGWAPFHYGRWFFDPALGWAWVPGYDWAPAWVTWGQYNDYYAWAPLAPGINISIGNTWRAPVNYWSFVPRNYINHSNLNRYASLNNRNINVNNITIINNYNSYNQKDYYHRGPDYHEVEQFTHKTITPVAIASASQPGSSRIVNRKLQIYRPQMSEHQVNNNGIIRNNTLSNNPRTYQGGVNGNSQPAAGVSGNINRYPGNPNLNNAQPGNNRGAIINGSNNSINGNNNNNITRENIDNTNRNLQQQQMENVRHFKNQSLSNQAPSQNPAAGNIQPSRPQPRLQNETIMQRPAIPAENERIMRQPQSPSMPSRMENREVNPGRNMQMERRGNSSPRSSRF